MKSFTILGLIVTIVIVPSVLYGIYKIQQVPQSAVTSSTTHISTSTVRNEIVVSKSSAVTASSDPTCDGDKDPYFSIGFGFEHTYTGEIKSGMPVSMVLSCDHMKLTITGVVQQVITSKSLKSYTSPEVIELADLASGDQVIDTKSDFNFDGYNDLSIVESNGNGYGAIDTYFIFLYNKLSNSFVFNPKISSLQNIAVGVDGNDLIQSFNYGTDGNDDIFYRYTKIGLLYKFEEQSCLSDQYMLLERKAGMPVLSYTSSEIHFNANGTVATSTKTVTPISQGIPNGCLGE